MTDGLLFKEILNSPLPPDVVSRNVSVRFVQGRTLLAGMRDMYAEVAQAQLQCARLMREAATKSEARLREIKQQQPVSSSFTSLWETSNLYVSQSAKLLDQLASLTQSNVVDQISITKKSYQETISQFSLDSGPDPGGGGSPPRENGASVDEGKTGRRIKRAEAKLQLALEELDTAQKSKEELVTRFGKDLKAELLQKASERVKRALTLKAQAESELNELRNGQSRASSPPPRAQTQEPHLKLSKDVIKYLESSERSRTQVLRDSIKSLTRMSFMAMCGSCSPLMSLCQAAESYSPIFDISSWIAKSFNVQITVESPDLITCLGSSEKSWLLKKGNDEDTDTKAMMEQNATIQSVKNLLKQRESVLKTVQEENALLKDEISLLKQGFQPGVPARNAQESERESFSLARRSSTSPGSPPAAGPIAPSSPSLGLKTPSKDNRKVRLSGALEDSTPPDDSSPIDQSAPSFSRAQSPKRRSSSVAQKPPEKASLFKRMATAFKGGQQPLADTISDDEMSEASSHTEDDRPRDEGDDEFRLSDYLLPLRERLKPDLPPDTKSPDKLLETERRFEEYLWALRNLHLANVIRNEGWDCEGYMKGLDIEYAFSSFTVKLPCNHPLTSDVFTDAPDALEWGAPSMTPRDWSLFAYETLLIVYHSMSQALISREMAKLPAQDIQEIKLADFTVARPDKSELKAAEDKAGGRHRRYSLLIATEDTDRDNYRNPGRSPHTMGGPSGGPVTMETPETVTANILEHDAGMIRNLIRVWRIRLKLAAHENSVLTSLLLPSGLEFGEEGYALGFSPLDVRYRVCRLHASWIMAAQEIEAQKQEKIMSTPLAKNWVFRQLHFLRIAILMKLVRLSRFLPQVRGLYKWLTTWSSKTNWHSMISKCIPNPEVEDDRFLKGNFTQLVECIKLSLLVLSDFFGALQSDRWGVDVYKTRADEVKVEQYSSQEKTSDDEEEPNLTSSEESGYGYRNAEGFLRLVALMSCISGIDKCIRYIIAEDERALVMGGQFKNVIAKHPLRSTEDHFSESSASSGIDGNPQDAGRVLFGENWKGAVEDFDLTAVLNSNAVDPYWQYELPIQHMLVAEMSSLVTDSAAPNKMVVDAPSVVVSLVLTSHIIQHGFDPTLWPVLKVSHAVMTSDSYALYVIKALWDEAVRSARRKVAAVDEFEVKIDTASESADGNVSDAGSMDEGNYSQPQPLPPNLMLSKDLLTHLNILATNFSNWLATSIATSITKNPIMDEETTLANLASQAGQTPEASLLALRADRVLQATPADLFISLERPRGQYRKVSKSPTSIERGITPDNFNKLTNATDPDFCVLDLPVLNEIADRPSFFQQIEAIREEPEGISLVLPSRVERVMVELCLRRLISNHFRNQLFMTLCNYRVHYETDTLSMAIQLWERVSDLLVLTPVKFPAQPPDLNHFSLLAPLPTILSGPIAQYDLYRYMIVQTIRNMFDRLFKAAFDTIHNPSEEDAWYLTKIIDLDEAPDPERLEIEKAWGQVIKKFADGCQTFLNELRAELVHYTPVWTPYLPGNQHALICMHAADDRLRLMFEDLSNSPFWPEDELPPNSAPIVAAFAHFDRLVKEIRLGTRFEQLLAEVEPLGAPLASSAATSLNKKLKSIEVLLERCIKAETWKPIAPPDALHSVTAVDYLQFVHHILEAVWEFHASPEWVIPIVIQFFGKLTRQFADFIKTSVADPRLTQVGSKAQTVFKHLLSPIPRVDVSLLSQLIGKDRRKRKGLGGVMALVGLGGKKSKRKDLAHQLQALQKQQNESEEELSPPILDSDEPNILSGDEGSQISDGDDADPEQLKKKSKKKKKQQQSQVEAEGAEITEELKELAAKVGPILAVSLTQVSASVGKSPLPTWLTRLHNLFYFSQQLEVIAQKVIQVAVDQAAAEDPQHVEIRAALEKAGGRKAVFYDKHDRLDEDTKKKFNEWKNQLESAVEQCRRMVNQRAAETCFYTALRVVYRDLCFDLFDDMYSPTFSSGTNLTNIVESLDHTVLKFVNSAPQIYKADLLKCILHQLIQAWAMLLTELGYAGHVFSPEDLAVVDSDLEAVRQFAATHFIDADMELASSQEKGSTKDAPSQRINVFDYMSEFVVFLGTQPLLLAQLGGNYQPELKKKPLTSAGGAASQPASQMPTPTALGDNSNEMANLFADMGAANAPGFNANDILGAKKKKGGMFGGVLKAVGLKGSSKPSASH